MLIQTKEAVNDSLFRLYLPELVMLCAVFKSYGAEFLFQFCAVDIKVGAEFVERRIAVAQVHVHCAEQHHWVIGKFHKQVFVVVILLPCCLSH